MSLSPLILLSLTMALGLAFAAALAMGIGMFVAGRRGKLASPIVITLHAGAAAIDMAC